MVNDIYVYILYIKKGLLHSLSLLEERFKLSIDSFLIHYPHNLSEFQFRRDESTYKTQEMKTISTYTYHIVVMCIDYENQI